MIDAAAGSRVRPGQLLDEVRRFNEFIDSDESAPPWLVITAQVTAAPHGCGGRMQHGRCAFGLGRGPGGVRAGRRRALWRAVRSLLDDACRDCAVGAGVLALRQVMPPLGAV